MIGLFANQARSSTFAGNAWESNVIKSGGGKTRALFVIKSDQIICCQETSNSIDKKFEEKLWRETNGSVWSNLIKGCWDQKISKKFEWERRKEGRIMRVCGVFGQMGSNHRLLVLQMLSINKKFE